MNLLRKKVKTSFALDPDLLDQLTKEAIAHGYSRSMYVSRILEQRKIIGKEVLRQAEEIRQSIKNHN